MQLSSPAGGIWWPAADPASRYIGSVAIRDGGPELTLFAEEGGNELPFIWLDPERTWNGEVPGWGGSPKKVSLIDCRRLSGPQPLVLSARLGVSGDAHRDPDASTLTEVRCRVPGLFDWIALRSRVRRFQKATPRKLGARRVEEYLGPQTWTAALPDGGQVQVSAQLPNGEPWLAPAPNYPAVVDFDAAEEVAVAFRPPAPFALSEAAALCEPFSWITSLAVARRLRAELTWVDDDTGRWTFIHSRDEAFAGNTVLSFEEPVRPPFGCTDEPAFAVLMGAWFALVTSSSLALETLFDGALDPGSSPRRRIFEAAGVLERLEQTALGGKASAKLGARIANALALFPAASWPAAPGDFKGRRLAGKALHDYARLLARKRNDVAHVNIPEQAAHLDDRVAAATLIHLCKLVIVQSLGVPAKDAATDMKAHYEWELVL